MNYNPKISLANISLQKLNKIYKILVYRKYSLTISIFCKSFYFSDITNLAKFQLDLRGTSPSKMAS